MRKSIVEQAAEVVAELEYECLEYLGLLVLDINSMVLIFIQAGGYLTIPATEQGYKA